MQEPLQDISLTLQLTDWEAHLTLQPINIVNDKPHLELEAL